MSMRWFGRSKDRNDDYYDYDMDVAWNEISYARDDLNIHDAVERREYIETCLQQLQEASRELDNLQYEYRTVTSYLKDMDELEMLTPEQRRQIEEVADLIHQSEMASERFSKRRQRMSEESYFHMQRIEKDTETEAEGEEYALLELGGNDCDFPWKDIGGNPDLPKLPFTPIQSFTDTYRSIVHSCRQRGAMPVMMSLPPLVPERFFDFVTRDLPVEGKENVLRWMDGKKDFIGNWHERYNLEVFRLAREMDIPLIDLTTPFLVRTDYFRFICRDGIHPNAEGHKLMAEALMAQWPW